MRQQKVLIPKKSLFADPLDYHILCVLLSKKIS